MKTLMMLLLGLFIAGAVSAASNPNPNGPSHDRLVKVVKELGEHRERLKRIEEYIDNLYDQKDKLKQWVEKNTKDIRDHEIEVLDDIILLENKLEDVEKKLDDSDTNTKKCGGYILNSAICW